MKKLLLFFFISIAAWSQVWPARVATDNDLFKAADSATGTLASPVNPTSLSLVLASPGNFVANSVITIDFEEMEICTVSGVNIGICPATRGMGGTTAASHSAGTTVANLTSAIYHNTVVTEIEGIEFWLNDTTKGFTTGLLTSTSMIANNHPANYSTSGGYFAFNAAGNKEVDIVSNNGSSFGGVYLYNTTNALGTPYFAVTPGNLSLTSSTTGWDFSIGGKAGVSSGYDIVTSSTKGLSFVPKLPASPSVIFNDYGEVAIGGCNLINWQSACVGKRYPNDGYASFGISALPSRGFEIDTYDAGASSYFFQIFDDVVFLPRMQINSAGTVIIPGAVAIGQGITSASLQSTGIVAGAASGSGNAFLVGNDAYLVDENVANWFGVYGVQNPAIGGITFGQNGPGISGIGTQLTAYGNLGVTGTVTAGGVSTGGTVTAAAVNSSGPVYGVNAAFSGSGLFTGTVYGGAFATSGNVSAATVNASSNIISGGLTVNNSAVINGDVNANNLNAHVNNTSFGHSSGCTTGGSAGSYCNWSLTWNKAFPNTNYAAVCTVITGSPYPPTVAINGKSTSGVTGLIWNGQGNSAGSTGGTVDCMASEN